MVFTSSRVTSFLGLFETGNYLMKARRHAVVRFETVRRDGRSRIFI